MTPDPGSQQSVSEDISGRKQEKKERQAEESRPRMKREEARLRHCREMLKGSGKGCPRTKESDAAFYGRRKLSSRRNVITLERDDQP